MATAESLVRLAVGEMVRRLCRGLVGEFALRKARNLVQGGGSGDGVTGDPVDETLKAMRRCQLPVRAEEKTASETSRVEAPAKPGPRWVASTWGRSKPKRGAAAGTV